MVKGLPSGSPSMETIRSPAFSSAADAGESAWTLAITPGAITKPVSRRGWEGTVIDTFLS